MVLCFGGDTNCPCLFNIRIPQLAQYFNNLKYTIMKKTIQNLSIMKHGIFAILVAASVTACNSKPKTVETAPVQQAPVTAVSAEDSMVLNHFHNWKAENELKDAKEYVGQESQTTAKSSPASSTKSTTKSASTSKSSSQSGSIKSESSNTAKAPEKKGISKAAKGAIIGGVTGAAGGAIINKKNRVAGGIIGGVIGAGAGYGIGRSKDKKDGRVKN